MLANAYIYEPGEIESVVEEHPDVASCHVVRSQSAPVHAGIPQGEPLSAAMPGDHSPQTFLEQCLHRGAIGPGKFPGLAHELVR